jgi:hypothetical protein
MSIALIAAVVLVILAWLPVPTPWWHVLSLALYVPIVLLGVKFGPTMGLIAGGTISLACLLIPLLRGSGEAGWLNCSPDFVLAGLIGGALNLSRARTKKTDAGSMEDWPLLSASKQVDSRVEDRRVDLALNPLASIEGAASLLADTETPQSIRLELAGIITSQCGVLSERLVNLVQHGYDAGATPITLSDTAQLIESAIRQAEFALCQTGAAVSKDIDPDLPPIECNTEQIHGALAFLIIRAFDPGLPGTKVAVRARHHTGTLHLDIQNSVSGVSPLRLLASRWFRHHPESGHEVLASIHAVVNAHGGRIEANLSNRKGLGFAVQLPLRRSRTCDEWQDFAGRGRP